MNNNETTWMAHHGIKGQKWGVRRYQNEDGSLTTNGKKRYLDKINKINKKIEDFNKKRMHDFKMRTDPLYRRTHSRRRPWDEKPSKKDPWDEKIKKRNIAKTKKMSDEELQNRINRLKKEAEYKDLKKRTSEGKEYAKNLMKSVGKQAAITATVAVTTYAAGKILKKG